MSKQAHESQNIPPQPHVYSDPNEAGSPHPNHHQRSRHAERVQEWYCAKASDPIAYGDLRARAAAITVVPEDLAPFEPGPSIHERRRSAHRSRTNLAQALTSTNPFDLSDWSSDDLRGMMHSSERMTRDMDTELRRRSQQHRSWYTPGPQADAYLAALRRSGASGAATNDQGIALGEVQRGTRAGQVAAEMGEQARRAAVENDDFSSRIVPFDHIWNPRPIRPSGAHPVEPRSVPAVQQSRIEIWQTPQDDDSADSRTPPERVERRHGYDQIRFEETAAQLDRPGQSDPPAKQAEETSKRPGQQADEEAMDSAARLEARLDRLEEEQRRERESRYGPNFH